MAAFWRGLERDWRGGFFRSWHWLSRMAAGAGELMIFRAERDGAMRAAALLGRRGRSLFLHESGDPDWDCVQVEHNGLLAAPDASEAELASCYRFLRRGWRLTGSGLTPRDAEAFGPARVLRNQPAPHADLSGSRDGYLAMLSANARAQLRRSARLFGEMGELRGERAATADEARAMFAEMRLLHERQWAARGEAGAFANPGFALFHDGLIATGVPAGVVEITRVRAGEHRLGVLYNFRHDGIVHAYQSGFDYARADGRLKPGLTCHHLAIERALAEGVARYDFLAGAQRYKTSLSTGAVTLTWKRAERPGSAGWWKVVGRRILERK